ncbi:hypothetical protein Z946_2277 [Sulfitobacter noctilucicola]|uniref:Uncharacterized protein n=1 Tax=Sulfitobacter noctilucicola TaxID=1342301 RepID=A0A7W6M9X0_9RHOB|nr:hypothetical protein [Sulfitobacter noctilucicola]KIN63405.1 hypothetical protein Z946_2277 [Sulfitobacter noctilucicola]MBB4175079.1 hypothetical protein [Sulfitobacter noctilucicola]
MAQDKTPPAPKTKAQAREERLKAALKANMGRRKAQARGRAAENNGPKAANEESS